MTPPVPIAAPVRLGGDERDAVRDAVDRVLRDGPWIGGPAVTGFEEAFGAYLGDGEVVGCANGTDALALALTALDLPPGGRVLVAANEGGYAATAARMVGLEPVAIDVDPRTLAPTVATAEAAHDAATVALVVTHLHGDPVDLDDLDRWRRQHGLALIEDCAQAHGARPDGRHVGLVGDAGAFSFYPTKNLGAVGDAGAVVTRDPALARRMRTLSQYGWEPRPVIAVPGGRNSRLDPIQAAVLAARLPFLDAGNERRRGILARYRTAAPSLDFGPLSRSGVAHHAVVRSDDRDGLARHLASAGVATAIHYPVVLGEMPGLRLAPSSSTPHAASAARRILSLPCAPELTADEILTVERALVAWGER